MRVVGDLAARLTGNIRDFSVKMDQAANKLDRIGQSAQAAGQKMSAMGRGLATSVTAPIVAVAGATIFAASKFEDAFVSVKKNLRDVDSATIEKLRMEIRALAKEIPVTASELSEIAATAAQLGIKTENLVEFTKNLAAMADSASDLSFDEAARSIASFGNVMGTTQTKLKNVMSAITLLGSTTNTSEGKIISMANRFTGAARSAGITEAQVLGLAAALSSVGLTAEMGGGNFAKVITEMNSKVKEAGKGLKDLADVSGLSSQEFKKMWETNATGALLRFIRGLKTLGEQGGDVAGRLDKIGFTGTEMTRVFTGATFALAGMEEALAIANQGFDEGDAHLKEAAQAWGTFSKQLKLVLNQLTDVGIGLGDEIIKVIQDLMPAMKGMIETLGALAKGFSSLPQPVKTAAFELAAVAAIAGPMLLVMGQLAFSINSLAMAAPLAAKGFGILKLALLPYLAMIGPGGWLLVGLGALVAYLAYKIPEGLGKAARAIKGSTEEMLTQMAKLTQDRSGLAEQLTNTTDRRMQQRIKDLIADLDERIANARKIVDERTVGKGTEVFGPEAPPKATGGGVNPNPYDPTGDKKKGAGAGAAKALAQEAMAIKASLSAKIALAQEEVKLQAHRKAGRLTQDEYTEAMARAKEVAYAQSLAIKASISTTEAFRQAIIPLQRELDQGNITQAEFAQKVKDTEQVIFAEAHAIRESLDPHRAYLREKERLQKILDSNKISLSEFNAQLKLSEQAIYADAYALKAALSPSVALAQEKERIERINKTGKLTQDEYTEALKRATEAAYAEGDALRAQYSPLVALEQAQARLNRLLKEGSIDQLTFNKAMLEARVGFYQTTSMGQLASLAFESVGNAVAESARGVLQGTQSMSEAFKRMEDAILTSILDGIIQNGLNALKNAFNESASAPGGFSWGGLIGSLASAWSGAGTGTTAAAPAMGTKSNLNGMLGRTAMGGVFRSPQVRSISEHGAEAVVPLPGGRKIPVQLKGGGSMKAQRPATIVNVNISTPNVQGFRASEGQVSSMVARMVNRATADG